MPGPDFTTQGMNRMQVYCIPGKPSCRIGVKVSLSFHDYLRLSHDHYFHVLRNYLSFS